MYEKVLCVDDEEPILKTLKRQLQSKYNVYTAQNGDEAFELMEEHNFPVIISDQRMEPQTGVELLQKIEKYNPNSIRILLTGYADFNDLMDSVNKAKIFRYILKPWDQNELQQIIQEGLELIWLRRERDELLSKLTETNSNLEKIVFKRTEALQKSEEKYRKLIECAADIIFKLDMEGNLIYANPYFHRFISKEREETIGENIDDLLGPGTFKAIKDNIDLNIELENEPNEEGMYNSGPDQLIFQESELMLEFEHHIEKPTLSLKIVPIISDNVVISYMVIARDITHHKTLQYHLTQIKNEAMRYIDLMTHDFNNINFGLMGFLELLQKEKHEEDSWRNMYYDRMNELIRLNIDIISTVKSLEILRENPPEFLKLNVSEGLNQAKDMFNSAYHIPDIKIRTGEIENDYKIMGDKLFPELFYNLFLTLIKMNKRGINDIFLTLETFRNEGEKPYSTQSLYLNEGWKISITDNITFIHDKVKEKFYSYNDVRPTSETGSGLSFHFIKTLTSRYGGQILFKDRTMSVPDGSTSTQGSVSEQRAYTIIEIYLPWIEENVLIKKM